MADVHPQWIERMFSSSSGRDQLGLGSVSSNQILQFLSPGINVLTYHPRYFSFYSFLLDEFWRSERPKTSQQWVKFFRPREYMFSVAAHLCDQDTHGEQMEKIVGSQKTESKARERLAEYDTTYEYIQSPQGGYGLYYRTVMAELDLLMPAGIRPDIRMDLPTPAGKEVAEAFRHAIAHTRYYQEYFQNDNARIPFDLIQEYAREACLCRLKSPSAPDRDPLLYQFLYGVFDETLQDLPASRRNTFRMFLDIADQTQGYTINDDQFRQLVYFGESDRGAVYQPDDAVIETHEYWRLFQLREYYAFALNAMWLYLYEWGLQNSGHIEPVPESDFYAYILENPGFDALAYRLGLEPTSLTGESRLVELLSWLCEVNKADRTAFDATCGIQSPINEHRLYSLAISDAGSNNFAADSLLAGMLSLLGLLIARFKDSEHRNSDTWKRISTMGSDGRLSVEGFMQRIDEYLKDDTTTVERIARWLYREYIILQHEIIATAKLPENTFRFQREGKRLRFFPHYNSLTFRDSRFESISTTLHELGLCGDFRVPEHPLTSEGEQLLLKGGL